MGSCLLCDNRPICLHYYKIVKKTNYILFTNNTKQVIDAISESIGKNCNHFTDSKTFESQNTCKWAFDNDTFSYIIECNKENFYIDIKSKPHYCPHCGKEIEVVK